MGRGVSGDWGDDWGSPGEVRSTRGCGPWQPNKALGRWGKGELAGVKGIDGQRVRLI